MAYPGGPLNVFVTHPFIVGHLDIRWDDAQFLRANIDKEVIGYNVFRSYDTPKGPYSKLNSTPIGAVFFRDSHNIKQVVDEVPLICSSGNNPRGEFVIATNNRPIVKAQSDTAPCATFDTKSVLANRGQDVTVTVDGEPRLVDKVLGFSGEIFLATQDYFDPVLREFVKRDATVTGDIRVTYNFASNTVITRLNQRIFYKVTTLDSSGLETPLNNVPAASYQEEDRIDYIWKEAVRRSNWILDQAGERVKLFVRKGVGTKCPKFSPRYKQSHNDECEICFGTTLVGGYEGPINISIAPPDQARNITWSDLGLHQDFVFSSWTSTTPFLSQRDFVVKPNGERMGIGPVNQVTVRGLPLLQFFDLSYRDEKDVIYKVPLTGSENTPADLEADPQITDRNPNIPAGQQLKGRTSKYGIIQS